MSFDPRNYKSIFHIKNSQSYTHFEKLNVQDAIGQLILNFVTNVPKGVLCFFTSYKQMDMLCERWKKVQIWSQMTEHKQIFFEPRKGDESLQAMMSKYYSAVDSGKGALMLAVVRGKVSEGLSFSDDYARAVIMVGIPYPNVKDPKIVLKKEYNMVNKKKLSGSEFVFQKSSIISSIAQPKKIGGTPCKLFVL